MLEYLKKYGANIAMLFFVVTVPILGGLWTYKPEPTQVTLQASEPAIKANISELAPVLQAIKQRQPELQPVQKAEPFQPVPDPMIEAINRMERNHQELMRQIVERDKKMSEQLAKFIESSIPNSKAQQVDRNGNTQEQLDNIYMDANVPVLPDPIAKGLAAYPGSRAMIHPDHGQPVIANVEYGITNYGGGKQISLIRKGGKMYPQTIMHGNAAPQQAPSPPKPEPFRLNLGNN